MTENSRPSKKRFQPFRFSICALIICVSVLGVVAGIWSSRAIKQKAAVEALFELCDHRRYATYYSTGPRLMRRFLTFVTLMICTLSTWSMTGVLVGQETIARENLNTRFEQLASQLFENGSENSIESTTTPPGQSVAEKLLALEEGARGSSLGLSCLYYVISKGQSASDFSALSCQQIALKRLSRHYVNNPNLDVVFFQLRWGLPIDESKTFYRDVIRSTEISYLRYSAMIELANMLAREANHLAMIDAYESLLHKEDENYEKLTSRFAELRKYLLTVKPDAYRSEASSILAHLQEIDASELKHIPRIPSGSPSNIASREFNRRSWSKTELVSELDSVRFEISSGIGRPALEISGEFLDGARSKLSAYQGNVVVLMFSKDKCAPCKVLYSASKSLMKKYEGKPLQFLGVLGVLDLTTARNIVDSEELDCPFWFDGPSKRITTQWNILGFPTMYVIDQEGIVRFKDLGMPHIERAINLLMKETDK